jgi:hypothetical protein
VRGFIKTRAEQSLYFRAVKVVCSRIVNWNSEGLRGVVEGASIEVTKPEEALSFLNRFRALPLGDNFDFCYLTDGNHPL